MYKVTGFLSALLLPLLSVGAIAAPSTTAVRQLACNGNAALCDRLYSNVSQVGAHDSPFVGSWVTDNQDLSVTAQLNAGIRFLQGQTHKNTFGKLHMCHTSCWELDVGHLTVYLTTIREWLDNNPNEVVTLLLTNGASVAATKFAGSFVDSGLTKYVYTPPTSAKVEMGSWPTLREMIASGTRLVAFLDSGADYSTVPYILDEFTYFFETPFDTTDSTFSECTLDRPSGSSPNGKMYIVNHFLDTSILGILIPNTGADQTTNAATGTGSIGAQADLCTSIYGRKPNFVLLDNFDRGQPFVAQNALNGL